MQGTPSAKQLEAFKSEKARHAAPSHICAGTGLTHATSAPGLGVALHAHRRRSPHPPLRASQRAPVNPVGPLAPAPPARVPVGSRTHAPAGIQCGPREQPKLRPREHPSCAVQPARAPTPNCPRSRTSPADLHESRAAVLSPVPVRRAAQRGAATLGGGCVWGRTRSCARVRSCRAVHGRRLCDAAASIAGVRSRRSSRAQG